MNLKKITIALIIPMLFFNIILISAQQNMYKVEDASLSEFTKQNVEQIQNQFQNRYMFDCSGECTYKEDGEKLMLEVKEQKRFLFFNVNMKESYELNSNGEIVQARYNIWSRLLNRNRITSNA